MDGPMVHPQCLPQVPPPPNKVDALHAEEEEEVEGSKKR